MRADKSRFRLFGIINPVDVLIVIGVVVLVWGAMLFSAPKKASAKAGDVTIRYTLELSEKEAGFFKTIGTGAPVFDSLKGYEIGTVVEAYALPYREDVGDEVNQVIRRAPVDGLEFTYIVVEAAAQITDGVTYVGLYDVPVNKEVYVISKDFAGKGYITALERK